MQIGCYRNGGDGEYSGGNVVGSIPAATCGGRCVWDFRDDRGGFCGVWSLRYTPETSIVCQL